MKTFLVILTLTLATLSFAEQPAPRATEEQFAKILGFRADLLVVESNFVGAKDAISPLYQRLEEMDPRAAATIAEFWRLRARVQMVSFLESESRRLRERTQNVEQAAEHYKSDLNMAIWSYYFDSWKEIKAMLLAKCEDAQNARTPDPEAQNRYLEYLTRFREDHYLKKTKGEDPTVKSPAAEPSSEIDDADYQKKIIQGEGDH